MEKIEGTFNSEKGEEQFILWNAKGRWQKWTGSMGLDTNGVLEDWEDYCSDFEMWVQILKNDFIVGFGFMTDGQTPKGKTDTMIIGKFLNKDPTTNKIKLKIKHISSTQSDSDCSDDSVCYGMNLILDQGVISEDHSKITGVVKDMRELKNLGPEYKSYIKPFLLQKVSD